MRKIISFLFLLSIFAYYPSTGYGRTFYNDYNFLDTYPPDKQFMGVVIPSIQYRGGNGRSYDNGYGSIEAFVAAFDYWCGNYPFLDARVHWLDHERFASNLGVGWRSFLFNDQMIGANVYYDHRHISQGDHFHQIGIGLELFGPCWDFRANGYIPVGEKRFLRDTTVFTYTGGFTATREEFDHAMWGLDLEIGKYLLSSRCRCIDFYLAAGPYFYDSDQCCNTLIGGMGRAALYYSSWLTLQFYITYDHLFHTKYQGEIILSWLIPCSVRCLRSLFVPVQRNEIMVKDRICCFTNNF